MNESLCKLELSSHGLRFSSPKGELIIIEGYPELTKIDKEECGIEDCYFATISVKCIVKGLEKGGCLVVTLPRLVEENKEKNE